MACSTVTHVQELEGARRDAIGEAARTGFHVIEHREREALQRVNATLYRREREAVKFAISFDPAKQAVLDGYRGAWRRQYSQYVRRNLDRHGAWLSRLEEQARGFMACHDEASAQRNTFLHATEALVEGYRQCWLDKLDGDRARALEDLASRERGERFGAAVEQDLRLRGEGERRALVVAMEEPGRASIALDEASARGAISHAQREGYTELQDRAGLFRQLRARVERQERTARGGLLQEHEDAWLETAGLLPEQSCRELAVLAEGEAWSALIDFARRRHATVVARSEIAGALVALSVQQSQGRASIAWAESAGRGDIVQYMRDGR
jgi:hypothetical protein